MNSLLYIYKRTWLNKIKKALRKPGTYVMAVIVVAYFVLIFSSFGSMAVTYKINNPKDFSILFTLAIFYFLTADIISYIQRKGLLFRPSEAHFIFAAPENPKKVLMYTGMKSFLTIGIFAIIMTVYGFLSFEIPIEKAILSFLFVAILQNIYEASLMIICYGNETLPERFFKALRIVLWAIILLSVVLMLIQLSMKGFAFANLVSLVESPIILWIPIIGWAASVLQLIYVGPTMTTLVGSILYAVSFVLLLLYATKMKCTGAYYEDAAKFAETYAKKRKSAKRGEGIQFKKKYLKNVKFELKGTYAKAIFYRQVLEYRKNRFFIFGFYSLLSFGVGIGMAVLFHFQKMSDSQYKMFIIPGVIAYMLFIFSSYRSKWTKELENPYTFLIPDTNIKKMWYATKIEHLRSIVDGCLITIPAAVMLKLNPVYTILTIALYVCLNANKLYMSMLSDALIGNRLGATFKSLIRLLLQGIAMGISVFAAILAGVFINATAGFAIMIVVTVFVTMCGAIGSSVMFERMEVSE